MALTITWSSTNGGSDLAEPLVHGTSLSQGTDSDAQTIFIQHNGVNPITSCGLYLSSFANGNNTTYLAAGGSASTTGDKAELIQWGDELGALDLGGILFNQNAADSFNEVSWPDLANPVSSDTFGQRVLTGQGDSSSNPITILQETGATSDGTIQAGDSPDVSFQMKLHIPASLSTPGTRLFYIVLKFNFTS